MASNEFEKFSKSLLNIIKNKEIYSATYGDSFNAITEEASNTLNVARASIWMFSENRDSIYSADLYEKCKDNHSKGGLLFKKDCPNYFEALNHGRFINANNAHSDIRTHELSLNYLKAHGISSLIDSPIIFNGKLIGVLCLEHIGDVRVWSEEEITYVSSLADLVSHSLQAQKRRQVEKALFESERRYRSLVENIPELVYRTDTDGVIMFASQMVTTLTGNHPNEVIGKHISQLVHSPSNELEDLMFELKQEGFVKNRQLEFLKKDGTSWWGEISAHLTKDDMGNYSCIDGVLRDVSKEKVAQEKLNYQATHDSLTGLINRGEFEKRVNLVLDELSSNSDDSSTHVMCFLDLDQFKVINDTFGHAAGDQLLRSLGELIQSSTRDVDTVSRLGGDEFGLILYNCSLTHAHEIASQLLDLIINHQFYWKDKIFKLGASIGLVQINQDSTDFTELFRQADTACYVAKDNGRNRIHTYYPDDTEIAEKQSQMSWVNRINHAMQEERFCLYAQEIFALSTDRKCHVEFLIRMIDESGKIIAPGIFLPAAERFNLIEKIDMWVITNACQFMAEHMSLYEHISLFSINISGPTLSNPDNFEKIVDIFSQANVSPSKVCFEITETVAVSNLNTAIKFIGKLKTLGFKFALDDFGIGVSSFGYLKNLPVDFLKIDGTFVKDILKDKINHTMVKSFNEIAHIMDMETIAEFVENIEIKSELLSLQVNFVQGYGLGKPMSLDKLSERYNVGLGMKTH